VKCEWEKDDGGVRERRKRRAEGEEEEDEEKERPKKKQRMEERRRVQKSRSEVEDSEAVQTEVPSGRERGSSRASNDTIAAIDGIRDVLGSLVAEQRRTNRWLSRINQHLLSRNQMLSEQAARDEEKSEFSSETEGFRKFNEELSQVPPGEDSSGEEGEDEGGEGDS
jgi:hypothetical protein